MQEIKYKGFWWLPSDSENKVAVDLTFSNSNGIKLNIIGSWVNHWNSSMLNEGQSETIKIILGISEAGKLITIYDSILKNYVLHSSPGLDTQKYRSKILFIDAHFTDPSDILFYKAEVDYSYLSDWANLPVPAIKGREYNLSYTYPEKISAKIAQGQISVVYRYSSVYDLRHVRLSACLQIEPKMELSFEDFYSQFIFPIKNFLTLATNRPNSPTSVRLYSRNGTTQGSHALEEIPIQAIFQTEFRENIGKKSRALILFSLEDIKSNFSLVMQKWFNVVNELGMGSLCNLFFSVFSVLYSKEMYAEHRFLNLVQAAELYHRLKKNNQVLPKNEHEYRRNSILNSIPEEHKEWLKQKLEFSNEPTLKERLSDLTKEVIIRLIDDPEKWIVKIKNTRNYYTHYNQSLKKKAAKGEELFLLTQELSFVLQTCLLIELGCSPERSAELVQKNEYWKYRQRVKENSQ